MDKVKQSFGVTVAEQGGLDVGAVEAGKQQKFQTRI